VANQPTYFSLSSTQRDELRSFLSRGDGFFHIAAKEIPSIVPGELARKWDSAAVVVSGSTTSNGAMALVGHRVDIKAGMLDQDPFVIAVSASIPQGSGVLIHHASYVSRSIELPRAYTDALGSSGLTDYFKRNPPFGPSSGSLSQVPEPLMNALTIAKKYLSDGAT
jgi:hypothetical protein